MNIIKFLIICTLFSVCVGSRTFYRPEMCSQMKNISDCSFQFSQKNACYVFEREECENFNFSSWNLKPLYQHVTEDSTEFTVSVLPYALYVYDIQKDHPVSAINIILTSLNKAITGFSVTMTEDIHERNVCRIFDFRKSSNSISVPFNFYYDCLYGFAETNWKNVSMVFKAYPLNTELSYLVYIPSIEKANSIAACSWPPLIMVFRGSLPNYSVQVKFSNAPKNLNIEFFNVTLVDSFGFAIDTRRMPPDSESDMVSCQFHVPVDGYYSVRVGIISEGKPCPESKTDTFYVGSQIRDYSLILFIVLTVVMILFASFVIYFSCLWYIKNARPQSGRTLLFVYSYKRPHHEFLVAYSRHLEKHYGLKVNTIYEKCGNPRTWLEEKYAESDVVVFVVSPTLGTLDRGVAEGEHHWVEQLAEAKALVDHSYAGTKRICKVCFPFGRVEHVPKCLQSRGPLFVLPAELDPFLCFVFGCPKRRRVLSRLFDRDHHRVPNRGRNDEDEVEKKLQMIAKTAPVAGEDKREKTKSDELPVHDNPTRKSNFASREAGDETENDDFMIYCIRKILYSG